jgi:cyclopropane fatty-acyl-phospholipid synthase-like methyltransferase
MTTSQNMLNITKIPDVPAPSIIDAPNTQRTSTILKTFSIIDILKPPKTPKVPDVKKKDIENAYGAHKGNWGDLDVFAEEFINFGYWKDIYEIKSLEIETRKQSEVALYKYVIKRLEILKTDTVLEIGCGRGAGIANVLSCMDIKKIIGIDIVDAQIERAITMNHRQQCSEEKKDFYSKLTKIFKKKAPFSGKSIEHNEEGIEFFVGSASSTGLESGTINKILSVEVFQHIKNFDPVAIEIKRVLVPGGTIAFCSHLSTNEDSYLKLRDENLLLDVIEILNPVNKVTSAFEKQGFKGECSSIGQFVFPGYERWITQINTTATDSHKIYESYERGYIDYFSCVFTLGSEKLIEDGLFL